RSVGPNADPLLTLYADRQLRRAALELREFERSGGRCEQHERNEGDSALLAPASLLSTHPPGAWWRPVRFGNRRWVLLRRRGFWLRGVGDGNRRVSDRSRVSGRNVFVVVEKILERLERVDVREGNPRPRVGVRVTCARLVDDFAPSFGRRRVYAG